MPTDTSVNSLVINKLTKAQYEGIQNPSETELYLVPDEKFAIVNYTSGTTIEVGKCYIVDASAADVSITLPTVNSQSLENVIIYATTGASTTMNIDVPAGVTRLYAESFQDADMDASSVYEVNCVWNGTNWIIAGMKLVAHTS